MKDRQVFSLQFENKMRKSTKCSRLPYSILILSCFYCSEEHFEQSILFCHEETVGQQKHLPCRCIGNVPLMAMSNEINVVAVVDDSLNRVLYLPCVWLH